MKIFFKSARPYWGKLGLAVIACTLCLCSLWVYASNLGNTNGNIAGFGQILVDGNDIYFGQTAAEGSTVRLDRETGEVTRVLRYRTGNLNLMDGWLYANLQMNNGGLPIGVYKFRPDGSELTRLVDRPLRDLHVYRDTIYGILPDGVAEGCICSIRTDGTAFRILSDTRLSDLSVDEDGMLYALQQNRLHRINPADGSTALLLDYDLSGPSTGYLLDGDTILYYDPYCIYAMPKDGSALPVAVVEPAQQAIYRVKNFYDQRVLIEQYSYGQGFQVSSSSYLLDISTGERTELDNGLFSSLGHCMDDGMLISCLIGHPSGQPPQTTAYVYNILTGESQSYDMTVDEIPAADFSDLGDGFRVHEIQADADMANIRSINADGVLSVCRDDSYQLVGLDGEVKFRRDDIYVRAFSEGMAVARYKGDGAPAGYIDTSGEFFIPPQFAGAHGFSSGLALVRLQDGRQAFIRKDGSYAYIAEDGERLTTFQNGFCTARFPDCTRIFDTDFQTVAIQYGGALEIAGATDRYVVLLAASDPDDLFDATFLIVSREGSVTYAAPYAVQGEDETSGTLRMFIPADIRNNLFYALQGDVSSDGETISGFTPIRADGTPYADNLANRLLDLVARPYSYFHFLVSGGIVKESHIRWASSADFYDLSLNDLGSLRYTGYDLRAVYPAEPLLSFSDGISEGLALILPAEFYQDGQTWPIYFIEPLPEATE